MKAEDLLISDDWLRRKIAPARDLDTEAGLPLPLAGVTRLQWLAWVRIERDDFARLVADELLHDRTPGPRVLFGYERAKWAHMALATMPPMPVEIETANGEVRTV